MTARIVFANGSKQLAHNLDDQYERWQLRREEMPELDKRHDLDRYSEMMIASIDPAAMSHEECVEQKEYLHAMKTYLSQRELLLRQDISGTKDYHQRLVKLGEHRALKHLFYRAGQDIDRVNRRISELKRLRALDEPSRQDQYVDFLRASINGIRDLAPDEETRERLTVLLKHSYAPGDEPLWKQSE